MKQTLDQWISDADALRQLEHFRVNQASIDLAHIQSRTDDYYLSLVGELFEQIRNSQTDGGQWARLGNAFAQFAAEGRDEFLRAIGVAANEASLFAAASFYFGGYPASAYLTIKERAPVGESEAYRVCFDLLARPATMTSRTALLLITALRRGDLAAIEAVEASATQDAKAALAFGPNEWIPARLFEQLVKRFRATNIRAVLPDGSSDFWNPLVSSLLNRRPPSWEFFPSQIEAIQRGLLERPETFSLQMPTGAGKTALCEMLLYWHLQRNPLAVAVLLVPYRSLAFELRTTLVKRLNAMGLLARCAYGGTVPLGDEVRGLDNARALVATPEALSGLLSANPDFFRRVSLVVCDEGHLLDSGARGVSLELLLSRMRAREGGAPRFVFVSAIVPNIEEINAWLGGTPDSVVRSDYRPALAEFSVLRVSGSGASSTIALDMHPHFDPPVRFSIDGFLVRKDFQFINSETRRSKTYSFGSVKTVAVAAARKALMMGAVAVFAANKRGEQGAIALADELLEQLQLPLPLPVPRVFANAATVDKAVRYLELEYGPEWVGTRTLAVGAALHHGDIPQESREVIESLVREGHVRLIICTTTLAEGVNLPIRTLVLYSVQRRQKGGRAVSLLARDIKNLVGRAGRAGATTKGLVICANEQQWPLVMQVAQQAPGEPVTGALRLLIETLQRELALQKVALTNSFLEGESLFQSMIDGIDATLIDLAAEEIGEEYLARLARELADETFASRQVDESGRRVLQDVFELRAQRVSGIQSDGRLGWIRETGTRARILNSVENSLLPLHPTWDDFTSPTDTTLVRMLCEWAWTRIELQDAVREAYRLGDQADTNLVRQSFVGLVVMWLSGRRFTEMAVHSNLSVDDMLGVYTRVLAFVFQTLVEQGVTLLAKLLESQGRVLAPVVVQFPEHLRFGVPTIAALALASGGIRHRRAAVDLGTHPDVMAVNSQDPVTVFAAAKNLLLTNREHWSDRFGALVFEHTMQDLTEMT